VLVGRDAERARIDTLLDRVREGRSGSLLIRGEPGIGKSALLDYAAQKATGIRVLRTQGVESESALPFSALHELVRPILARIDALPEPQQQALRGCLALAPMPSVDPFAACVATLGLLAAQAEEGPVLCLVDDAHWVDAASANAFAFTCRRLEAEGILVLLAVRDGAGRPFEAPGVPELRLGELDRASAVTLLRRSTVGMSGSVIDRVIAVAGGNPLALLEIPRALGADGLGAGVTLGGLVPVGDRVQQAFLRQASSLSEAARWAMLLAAASDRADAGELSRLAGVASLEEAETAGLIVIEGERVAFRHPLVRASIYDAATPARRRAAHGALAAATNDRASRAWHLAAAAVGPHEDVAAALEEAAIEALARGAPAVSAATYERAARLSPDAESRARRLYSAGEAAWLAGQPAAATKLLDEAVATTRDAILRADIQGARGRVLMWTSSVIAAHELLVAESERVIPIDPARGVILLVSGAMPAMMGGRVRASLETTARARDLARRIDGFPHPIVEVCHATGLALLRGHEGEGRPALTSALALLKAGRLPGTEESFSSLAQALMWLGDYDGSRFVFEHVIDAARRGGTYRALPFALGGRAELDARTSRFSEAYTGALESVHLAREIGQETGSTYSLSILARVEGAQGREADCRAHVARALELASSFGATSIEMYAGAAIGLLELGIGRIPEAIAALQLVARLCDDRELSLVSGIPWVPDLIEACSRAGRAGEVRELAEAFERQATSLMHPWALATAARCRGLLSGDEAFAEEFERALALHHDLPSSFERARTELVYGERLRRARNRTDARTWLRSALATFELVGAVPWAARARGELSASGDSASSRRKGGLEDLTPQELQVAMLVAEGKTNREAASALFVSAKTIEYHLHNVFAKLGLRSRTELARRFASTQSLRDSA
jgi:DNA-binding CsgD family transcriptional regulator